MPSEESPKAKFDRLKKQLQDSILKDYPNPERKGCPRDAVLRELAERPLEKTVEDDPHWHHVTHCSECYGHFLAFNNAFRHRAKILHSRIAWGVPMAASVVAITVLLGLRSELIFPKRPQNAERAWTNDTLVVPSETRSGNLVGGNPIFLRRLPLRLTVQLPIGSKAGDYELQFKLNDRTVTSAGGNATINDGTTSFVVKVDLSGFEPGRYSMIVRQVPLDWNLYPVVIR